MSSGSDFEKQLKNLLAEAADRLNVRRYTSNLNLDPQKGDGFLGEFYKVSITDEETDHTYHLAVKKAPTEKVKREQLAIESVYKNEIWFYTEIAPAFRKFELEHRVPKPFGSIADYLTSDSKIGEETIVFEDLTKSGYLLRERDLLLDDQHAAHIFKTYGHFHAISFCLKQQEPEEFDRLKKPLLHIWKEFSEKDTFPDSWKPVMEKANESLDPVSHRPVIEKFQKYRDDIANLFLEYSTYKGQHFGILHGDCWSNNMMFKYEDASNCSKLADMKLLDFQFVIASSPVYDLSYFFYTGGSKKLFDQLEQYLDIYYESFSKAAKELDCDPEELLPRKVLSEDWKRYSKFGMMLAIMLTKIKLISREETLKIIDAVDSQEEGKENRVNFDDINYNEELFLSRVRDILLHMYEIDAL